MKAQFEASPLFGNKRDDTHWLVFTKENENNMTTKQQAPEAFERYLETGNFEYAKVVAGYLLCNECDGNEEC